MGLKSYKIPPSYGHPPYQGGQGGSSAKTIVSLIVTSYLVRFYELDINPSKFVLFLFP